MMSVNHAPLEAGGRGESGVARFAMRTFLAGGISSSSESEPRVGLRKICAVAADFSWEGEGEGEGEEEGEGEGQGEGEGEGEGEWEGDGEGASCIT